MRVQAVVSPELREWFDRHSARSGLSLSAMIAAALAWYRFQIERGAL